MYDAYLHDPPPAFENAFLMCNRVSWLLNELASYEKEAVQEGGWTNLVHILEESGSTFEEAADRVVDVANESLKEMLACQDAMTADDDRLQRALQLNFKGLCNGVIGGYEWTTRATNRYRSETSPFPELRGLLPQKKLDKSFLLG